MKKIFMAFFAICILSNTFGQNKKKDQEVDIIDHQVQLGESVRLISKKYLVDPGEIYKLNKFAVEGISQGMVLKIPVPKKEVAVKEVVSAGNNDTASNQNDGAIQKETTTEVVKENPTPTPKIISSKSLSLLYPERRNTCLYASSSIPKRTPLSPYLGKIASAISV